jgi:hypothetical protein
LVKDEFDIRFLQIYFRLFTTYKDELSTVAAIVTTVGIFITSWAVFRAQKHIKSDLIYKLQKNGRGILNKILEDENVYDYLRNYDEKRCYAPEIEKKAYMHYHVIVNYYNAAFDQRK